MRRRAARTLALLAAALPAFALAGCGDDGAREARPPSIERLEVGEGAASAVVFRPGDAADAPPGVLFLHGWGAVEPDSYLPWIRHLVERGNQVIYPRYQVNALLLPGLALANVLLGTRAALERAPVAPGSLVVAGHSAGGAMSADLAAVAAEEGLPEPQAIYAVYPGRRLPRVPLGLPEADLAAIPADTEIVALAGADDTIVGARTARRIVRAARQVPARLRRFRLVRDPAVASHLAPLETTPAAQATFWAPLDRLIARARRR